MHIQHKHGENGMGEKDKEFLQEELISSQPNKNTTKIKTTFSSASYITKFRQLTVQEIGMHAVLTPSNKSCLKPFIT